MAEHKMNIMQIDVEPWYCGLDSSEWSSQEDRVVQNTIQVLNILKEFTAEATFFVLGYVAENHPCLVERIQEEGHEIASHGYYHAPLTKQSPSEFEKDLVLSLNLLKKISATTILGYRAPSFTVVDKTSWAIDILKKNGLKYDSSIFPVKTHLYGVPDAPKFPYRISSKNIKIDDPEENFLEVPLSTYKIPLIGRNLPIAGGFYLRFFPYFVIKHAIRKINEMDKPAVCYLHPWELDPKQPRVSQLSWYHYHRLSATKEKFKKLLKDFKFTSVKEYFQL